MLVYDYVQQELGPVLQIRIRVPVPFWPLDPGSGMGKKIKIQIRDEHPGSYFRKPINNFRVKNN